MRKLLLPFIFIFIFISGYGQKNIRCGTDEIIRQQMAADPAFAKKVNETRKKQIPAKDLDQNKGNPISITIPVVVHVVYYSAEQNISDEQVRSQIVVMNEDFTATNKDYNNYDAGYRSVKGDFDMQFCLAQVIHKQTSHKTFPLNDAMKFTQRGGSDAVDPLHYLNIWVCDIGDKYLGYAYLPGTISAERFGVVCHYKAFGKGSQYNLFSEYNLGRTVTHEVGHCFGLEHIWGDAVCGNDLVDDTPLHDSPNFGCPGEGHLSTCTGTPLEMWMNYMDYTADRCMYFFSDGQATRAGFFIEADPQLNSIINSTCTNARTNNSDITITSNNTFKSLRTIAGNISLYPTITSGQLTLYVNNSTEGKAEINIYNQAGALMMKQQIFISNGKRYDQIDVSRLPNGIYFLEFSQATIKQTNKFIVHH
ncbi:MAG TPA: M43 family zinc metalloprotease [Chitinophagaceae bacterium]|nr:M43 family zinc metalloprotease [Chitinophagaceae bacterium]